MNINIRNLTEADHRHAKTAAAIASETLEQFATQALRERAHRYYPKSAAPATVKPKKA